MRSATDLLIHRTYEEIWKRGEKYANSGKVKISKSDDREAKAIVIGTNYYNVSLKFSSGGISKQCNCPYYEGGTSRSVPCKHIIALAIVWDESRGIKRPSKKEVEFNVIPPPFVTRSQIQAMYKNPINADLETLRIAAEERGSWSRPHARLPNMPRFSSDNQKPLSLRKIKTAFTQIEKWTDRRNYDYYFCAGEMVAAFCEIMRIVSKRILVTPPIVSAKILWEAQKFHYVLLMELVDDSDGLSVFTEAHLENVYKKLKKIQVPDQDRAAFDKKLKEFTEHRDDY
ncbi:MAG: SWIM zinc finger family protein [Thermodesulfobacteriota bacterium]